MRKYLYFLFLVFFLFLPTKIFAESINSFEAIYEIEKSGTVNVTEKIEYDFGLQSRHGIFRYMPIRETLDDGGTHYINISDLRVTDSNGRALEFERYTEKGNLVIKIGDPNKVVSGQVQYIIFYKVRGGLRYFDSHDEFYWDVNGNGWLVDVNKISAKVVLPKGLDESKIEYRCFSGAYGSSSDCESTIVKENELTFGSNSLRPSEGLTVVVGVPAGTFEKLDAGFMGSGISDGLIFVMVLVALGLVLAVFLIMIKHWWKHGRDPKGRGTIIPEYKAPEGLSPIEVGTLLDNTVDTKDISAQIISLGVRGFLKIRKEDKKLLKKQDFILIKTGTDRLPEKVFDRSLLSAIFNSSNEVSLSSLKDRFYKHINSIKNEVHEELLSGGYFKSNVATTISKYVALGIAVAVFGFFIARGVGNLFGDFLTYIYAPAFIISGLIISAFGIFMPARTEKGVLVKEKSLGLKEYMKVAESDRLKFHNAPSKNPKKFEELLPYAMVLGVEKEWAKQFDGVYQGSPSWYEDSTGNVFVPLVLINNLNSFNSVAASNLYTAPSSSGSGFGGGGFSGGGFGGGGGGSW
ncbi:MAG: DUF2207 domain-containing protein [Patescibacteria group bacterium]|nr:DUF2207 domain-containing protein [Patescibacteria group bacterium]